MAENDDEGLLEEGSDDSELEEMADDKSEASDNDSEEAPKKKGLSKPLIIKIAIGVVVVLLLAGGAYFFLASPDEEKPEDADAVEETSMDADEELLDSEMVDEEALDDVEEDLSEEDALDSEGLDEVEEESIELPDLPELPDDESEEMKDTAADSDDQLTAPKPEGNVASEAEIEAIVQEKLALERKKDAEARVAKLKSERYKNVYEEETRGYPWTRKPKSQPMPDPKWGEFERVTQE